LNMREKWASIKMTFKAATEISRLALSSVSALIYAKWGARKAKATFRRILVQQGLPDEAIDALTSTYGVQLSTLTSISHWMRQSRH